MSRCTLPTTPGALLGHRKNGSPIFLIAGGSAPAGEPTPPAAPPATPPAPAAPAAPAAPSAPPPASDPQDVKSLPDWAQKLISDTRKEAGDARVAGKTAADLAQKELTDKLAVALGLKPDAATDPAELAKQIAAAQDEAKSAAQSLAVHQAATKPGVDGDAASLLDSTSFMAKIKALDHKAADFATKVEAAIKDAVTSNPKLKTVQAAGKSGAQFTGGSGEGSTTQRPTSLHAAIAARNAAG